ncbi:unnamed protein product [Aphanomyces euteiches]|uniref:protein-tyrosine-phosphatase n=1 Tax=Aphanomyces euteiches TaxID=100861 RepID=A0A6G0WLX0_9STRA|nr:hypothetical protein Ae201684_013837 [Aphanomyces euteiches]KAH9080867.1 hypothetical protein Ae201684P_007953 [Aphanomyces euteiches]KAH9139655.1 hypothetical protein AeRB84_016083 [Aphanomyces euteiches]
MTKDPVVEFIPRLVYYTTVAPDAAPPRSTVDVTYFSVDNQLIYTNFYLDFGPLNLGQTFLFCQVLNHEISRAKPLGTKLIFYSSADGKRKANAICLLGCWGIIFNAMTADQAMAPFQHIPLPPFHDATPSLCLFKLSVLDCLRGLEKALRFRFVSPSTFSIDEYQYYEQVEHGDLNWLSPKFIAFAGPHDTFRHTAEGYVTLTPEHYVPYFQSHNVTLVIRLNEKLYDEKRFTSAGIDHLDLYYPDGANPPDNILDAFLHACETTPGAVAVHCKAGLGRTGTCIGAYLMKHFHFTAKECIGWLRLCRAGSVIGPQQQYMESIQQRMWNQRPKEDSSSSHGHLRQQVHVSPCKARMTKPTGNIFNRMLGKPTLFSGSLTSSVVTTSPSPSPPPSPTKAANIKASLRLDPAATYTAAYADEESPKTQGDSLRELKHTWAKSPKSPTTPTTCPE